MYMHWRREETLKQYHTTTPWERLLGASSAPSTHRIWSRLLDGEHIFTVLPDGKEPGPNDGGYRSIDAALRQKGML
jgi:hypothetical protein